MSMIIRNVVVVPFLGGRDERELSLLGIFVEPESMNTTPRRNVGLEETHFARLGRIADIVKANASFPGSFDRGRRPGL